jgi:hypothetical protein
MHHKSEILLNWEIDTLEYYFANGMNYYSKLLQNDFVDDGKIMGEKEYLSGSFQFFRRSVFYELNSMIELWLLNASTKDGEFFDNKNLKRTRAKSIQIIKERYKIELNQISEFENVEIIRKTVNSLKHRGGFDLTDFSKGIPEFKSVKDDINHLKILKEAAIKFLKELVADILIIDEGKKTKNNTV